MSGPHVIQLAGLWPNGSMDNHGIKRAICRAKDRKRALYGRLKVLMHFLLPILNVFCSMLWIWFRFLMSENFCFLYMQFMLVIGVILNVYAKSNSLINNVT